MNDKLVWLWEGASDAAGWIGVGYILGIGCALVYRNIDEAANGAWFSAAAKRYLLGVVCIVFGMLGIVFKAQGW